MNAQRQQIRAHMLNQRVYQLLESGKWGDLYNELADCYRSVGLTVPKEFILSAPNGDEAEELAKQIKDKRIVVSTNPKVGEGKLVLEAVFK